MISPKVSIIIPTYNREQYIVEALESALAQTYPNLEIIVVDDGSKDGTRSAIEPFLSDQSGRRVACFYQENKGVSAARNLGIQKAKGDYLLFLDSDDIAQPNLVEALVSALGSDPACGVAYSEFLYFTDGHKEGLSKPAFIGRYYSGDIFSKLIEEGNFVVNIALVRRECLVKAGLFQGQSLVDWDLWLRIAYQGYRFCHVGVPLVLVRKHESNLTLDKVRAARSRAEVLDRVSAYVTDSRVRRQLNLKKRAANAHFWLGWQLVKRGSRAEGIAELLKWLKMSLSAGPTRMMQDLPRNIRLLLNNAKY